MTTTSIMTTAPMSSVRVETSPGIRATKTPRIPFSTIETPIDYKDCFDSELVIKGFNFGYKAWKIKGKAQNDWQSLRGALQTYLMDNKPKILQRLPLGYKGHISSPYKLDCYLVGQRQTHALPRVAVCCGEVNYAKAIRFSIIESGLLGGGSYPHFSACFVIVAHVSQYMNTNTGATHIVSLPTYQTRHLISNQREPRRPLRHVGFSTIEPPPGDPSLPQNSTYAEDVLDPSIDLSKSGNLEKEKKVQWITEEKRWPHHDSSHIQARGTYDIYAAYKKDAKISFVGGALCFPGPVLRRTTIGGLVQIGDSIFAMTVFHSLREDLETPPPTTNSSEAFILD
ncbi:hypothetical protein BS50DRAFT_42681 [Corynespora cassiicola Philippines]|uniref:Uncharacterized protein n=1 Tax=Corynespora cassiicola Philippines TaxID=1448308 RepID=A0A2T2PE36_CORCC|nr:hypothetical protein BS50DRAFT_42681 [Corynespora cassiicola Philippines]